MLPVRGDSETSARHCMGRLESQKGFKYLLDAFSKVSVKIEAQLTILGREPQMDELNK